MTLWSTVDMYKQVFQATKHWTNSVKCPELQDSQLIHAWLWVEVRKIRRLVGRHLTSNMNELGDSGLVEVC